MILEQIAKKIRRRVLELLYNHHTCHLGSCMSCIEILTALYFGGILKGGSKFICSEGHIAAALYTILAEKGFFSWKELLKSYATKGTKFLNLVNKEVPGVEVSCGSLGHGLPMAMGVALADRNKKVFCLLSDGECQPGTFYESLLFSGHHKLNNLVILINNNRIQACDWTEKILNIEPLDKRIEIFGWKVQRINGHDIKEIMKACKNLSNEKPNAVICDTIKGKGISFAENSIDWHYWDLTSRPKFYKIALSQLPLIEMSGLKLEG